MGSARSVGVMDDQFANSRIEQRDGDRAARPAGADLQHPRAFRLGALVFLRLTKARPSSMSPCHVRPDCGA